MKKTIAILALAAAAGCATAPKPDPAVTTETTYDQIEEARAKKAAQAAAEFEEASPEMSLLRAIAGGDADYDAEQADFQDDWEEEGPDSAELEALENEEPSDAELEAMSAEEADSDADGDAGMADGLDDLGIDVDGALEDIDD